MRDEREENSERRRSLRRGFAEEVDSEDDWRVERSESSEEGSGVAGRDGAGESSESL